MAAIGPPKRVPESVRHERAAGDLATGNPCRLGDKLWLYTNFDCNLRCSYCATESSPRAPRRPLGVDRVFRLVDEGIALGFRDVFLTGGEPFMLPDVIEMLGYASSKARTTVLTNGILLRGSLLDQFAAIASQELTIQVSLDGALPEHNDGHRGAGTWSVTVDAIKALKARGLRITVSTTETPDNSDHLGELRQFLCSLGVAPGDHLVRPLARRGFSQKGIIVGKHNLVPELSVSASGIYWHPLLAPSATDTLVSTEIFPLSAALKAIEIELGSTSEGAVDVREEFT